MRGLIVGLQHIMQSFLFLAREDQILKGQFYFENELAIFLFFIFFLDQQNKLVKGISQDDVLFFVWRFFQIINQKFYQSNHILMFVHHGLVLGGLRRDQRVVL